MDSYERKNLIIQLIEELGGEEKTFPEYESDDFDRGYEYCREEVLKKSNDKEFLEKWAEKLK